VRIGGYDQQTDFDSVENCRQESNGNCDRASVYYLVAAPDLLISELRKKWTNNWKNNGERLRVALSWKNTQKKVFSTLLTGMGSLAYGEFAENVQSLA